MAKILYQYVIANICKWCNAKDASCLHCVGTGDHDFRVNGEITYKKVRIGKIL